MADKVTKIPNQNNINSVIAAQVQGMTDIVEIIVKAANNGVIKYSSNTIDTIKIFSEVINSLFGKEGILNVLMNATDSIQKLKPNKKDFFVNRFMLLKFELKRAINFIHEIGTLGIDTLALNNTKALTSDIKSVYKELLTILETTSKISETVLDSLKSLIVIRLRKKTILAGIETISAITKAIVDNFTNLKINKRTVTLFDRVAYIIDKVANVSLKIIALGILAIPTIIAAVLVNTVLLPAIAGIITGLLMLTGVVEIAKPGIDVGMKSVASIMGSLLIVGASIILLAIIAPAIMTSLVSAIFPLIVMVTLSMLIIWGAFKIIGKLATNTIEDILAFGLVVVILTATLIASALVILIASKVADQLNENIGKVVLMIGGMIALTAAIVLLGLGVSALTPFITSSMVGLGQMLGVVGLILGIGLTINVLAQTEVKSQDAADKTKEIVTAVNLIRTELDSLEGSKKEWRKDKKILKKVNRTVKTINKIANNLNSLQSVTLDQDKIITNVTSIMSFTQKLQDLMNKLLFGETINSEDYTNESGNWLTRNLGSVFNKDAATSIRKEMKANKKVLNKVDKVINQLVGIAEGLVSIGDFKLTGEFKTTIENNIGEIFGFIDILDSKIKGFMNTDSVNPEEIIDAAKMSKRQWRQSKKALSKVEATIATIHGITDTLNILKDFKFVEGKDGIKGTKDIIIDNVGIVMNTVKEIAGIVNGKNEDIKVNSNDIAKMNPLIDFINSLNNGFKDLSTKNDTTEKNINNYIKLFDKVNTVDVTKLETSTNMFKQMASFSKSIKGDFDKLAESLSEKLLPVLTELKDVMTSVPEELKVGFQNTSASIAATNAPATKENITAQVNRENPNMTVDEVNKIVTNRMNERARSDANSVASKLDELIGLLKGYSGENVIVKTV